MLKNEMLIYSFNIFEMLILTVETNREIRVQ